MASETARLTADVVLFGQYDIGELCVLMIRRGWDPFAGRLALPGGHVDLGEDTAFAARRELAEETGLVLSTAQLTQVGVYAAPGRDPRGRYVTFAYAAQLSDLPAVAAGDDATDAAWMPVDDVLDDEDAVAFDHARIIRDALTMTATAGRRPDGAPGIVVTNSTAAGNIVVAGGNLTLGR